MTTEERLEKLERELGSAKRRNRWLVTAVALTVAGLSLGWTLTTAIPAARAKGVAAVPKTVRAREFVLVDERGTMRAMLGMGGEPVLILADEKGLTRAMLTVNANGGGSLFLHDKNNRTRIGLSAGEKGSMLFLNDENENHRAVFGVAETVTLDGKTITYPESSLLLFGPDGKVIWQAPE